MTLSFQKLKKLNTEHGINLLKGVPKEKLSDFDFWHTILVVALGGEAEALAYEAEKSFVDIIGEVTSAVQGGRGGVTVEEPENKS